MPVCCGAPYRGGSGPGEGGVQRPEVRAKIRENTQVEGHVTDFLPLQNPEGADGAGLV